MKLFLDTADINEIREATTWGILDGVTTNPTHIARTGRVFKEVTSEILEAVSGPVSIEVTATDYDGMLSQAREFVTWGNNVVVGIPLLVNGLQAVNQLTQEGIRTNVTLCFSSVQALLAAKAGATYISPFVGELDEIQHNGLEVVSQIRKIYDIYGFQTQLLAAGLRHVEQVRDAALAGANAAAMSMETFQQLVQHPLTDSVLEKFAADWQKVPV